MPTKALLNIRSRTSEIDKLKPGKFLKVYAEPRTLNEIFEVVFGKNAGLIDYLLPTPT
jgi:hypothetical protein